MTQPKDDDECGVSYHYGRGGERRRHVCHRKPNHRRRHHSDGGLWWGGHPLFAAPRLSDTQTCSECELTGAAGRTKKGKG